MLVLLAIMCFGAPVQAQKVFFDAPIPDSLVGLAVYQNIPGLQRTISFGFQEGYQLDVGYFRDTLVAVLKRPTEEWYTVVRFLQMPELVDTEELAFGCVVDDKPDRRVFGIARSADAPRLVMNNAWMVDVAIEGFVPIVTVGVECTGLGRPDRI